LTGDSNDYEHYAFFHTTQPSQINGLLHYALHLAVKNPNAGMSVQKITDTQTDLVNPVFILQQGHLATQADAN
jgi:hypothetical protein